jgi:hypothetical protein
MTAPSSDPPGFAPDDDAPIAYMARTREYYQAIGYTTCHRRAKRPVDGKQLYPAGCSCRHFEYSPAM